MISRPSPDLPDAIAKARQRFRLSVAQMAAELRIRPEWLSKIVHRHAPASYNIGLRFEDFLRRRGTDLPTLTGGDTSDATRPAAITDRSRELRAQIQQHCGDLLNAAGDNPRQLEWLAAKILELRILPRSQRPPKAAHPAKQAKPDRGSHVDTPLVAGKTHARREFLKQRLVKLSRK